jgi:aspartate--ammonia ligase
MSVTVPKGYKPALNIRQTEVAIKKVKDFFERDLAIQLNLTRVSAPLFVDADSGLNDNLNGIERPVAFDIKGMNGNNEIVQSLAKWKRMALDAYGFEPGEGLYTDMSAIRRDEDTDNIHSVYVDQWDWEKVITAEQRCFDTLKRAVKQIYTALIHTEIYIAYDYPFLGRLLPEKIAFITAQELEDEYPDLTPKQREYEAAKKHEILVVPCDDFGVSGYVRIAYCTSKSTVVGALPAFKALALEYKNK